MTKEQKRAKRQAYKKRHPDKIRAQKRRTEKRKAERNIAAGLTADGKPRYVPKISKEKKNDKARRIFLKKVIRLLKTHVKNLQKIERAAKKAQKRGPKEVQKAWRAANPDYGKNYAIHNAHRLKKLSAEYYINNKEKYKLNAKKYRQENPEKCGLSAERTKGNL